MSMRVSRTIHAPRDAIYRACLAPEALAAWRVPDGMTARVHELGDVDLAEFTADAPRQP